MIATTTSGDIIVIVAFVTILVLVATGILAATKWLMQRKPRHSGFSKIFQHSRKVGNGFYTGDETADMVDDKHHRIDRWPSWPCRRRSEERRVGKECSS